MPRTSVTFRGVSVYVEYVNHLTQIDDGPVVEDFEWTFVNPMLEDLIISEAEADDIAEQLRQCDDEGDVNP